VTGSGRPVLEILEPGLLTTVQDLGRRGREHLGVPRAGAADSLAIAGANLLAGNDRAAAALECTLVGPTFRALQALGIGLAGADLGAVVTPGGRRLEPWRRHRLDPGEVVDLEAPGDESTGCRAYVAIEGGIDVPVVLGSRSTSLVGAFGGLEGRQLRSGDVLRIRADAEPSATSDDADGARATELHDRWVALRSRGSVGVLPGPAVRDDPDAAAALAALVRRAWTVSGHSDRRGLRLETADEPLISGTGADRPSHGVLPGAIQLTPSGQPLVLMPDAGTTGGYPVIGVVRTADLPALGQLVPGAEIRFVLADV